MDSREHRLLGYLNIREGCGGVELSMDRFENTLTTDIALTQYKADRYLVFMYAGKTESATCQYEIILDYDQADKVWNGHRETLSRACPQSQLRIKAYDIGTIE